MAPPWFPCRKTTLPYYLRHMTPTEILAAVTDLHAEVDRRTAPLARRHGARLRCARGCTACCQDDLTVLEVEAHRIRAHAGDRLAGLAPHPPGACAFLDPDGACRIYPARPYVCRTQGLPLRWLDDEDREQRDICPLNTDGEPLARLAVTDCWTLGPVEDRLAGLQVAAQEALGFIPPQRIGLRSLFAELSAGSTAV